VARKGGLPTQQQRIPDRHAAAHYSEEHLDCEVLHLILIDDGWPWSVAELACELGDEGNALDAVGRLTHAGLLHRFGEFVFPTRTARRAARLQVGTA
jgi:hypothetical protein